MKLILGKLINIGGRRGCKLIQPLCGHEGEKFNENIEQILIAKLKYLNLVLIFSTFVIYFLNSNTILNGLLYITLVTNIIIKLVTLNLPPCAVR